MPARNKYSDARKILAAGDDPGEAKKEVKRLRVINSENTFEAVALEWYEKRKHKWATATGYSKARMACIKRHLFPKLGGRPIADISSLELLSVIRIVEEAGSLDRAQRLLQMSSQIYVYAVATGRASRNIATDIRGALKPPVRKHMARLEEDELPEFLRKLENYDGALQTKLALKLLLLTFVRNSELRGAEWSEIKWDQAEWRIPAERMKMKELHIVPLASPSLSVMPILSAKRKPTLCSASLPDPCYRASRQPVIYAQQKLEISERRAFQALGQSRGLQRRKVAWADAVKTMLRFILAYRP